MKKSHTSNDFNVKEYSQLWNWKNLQFNTYLQNVSCKMQGGDNGFNKRYNV